MSPILRRSKGIYAAIGVVLLAVGAAAVTLLWPGQPQSPITVASPVEGALFPPDFAPPTFEWRDASPAQRVAAVRPGVRHGLSGL